MKDIDRFLSDLNAPPKGTIVTGEDLDRDAANFMAFASAMGVKPPGVPLPTSTPEAVEG